MSATVLPAVAPTAIPSPTAATGRLTPAVVRTLRIKGKYYDGDGLFLHVATPTRRYWAFRYQRDGRRRTMTFGHADRVTLQEARQLAVYARMLLHQGIDPLIERGRGRPRGRPNNATLQRLGITVTQWERCQTENQQGAEEERRETQRQCERDWWQTARSPPEMEAAPPASAIDQITHERLTLRVATAADTLNVSPAFVRTLIKQGKLRAVTVGNVVLVSAASVRALAGLAD